MYKLLHHYALGLGIVCLGATAGLCDTAQAQEATRRISGLVLSSEGTPIANAQIRIEGKSEYLYTNKQGVFSLEQAPTRRFRLVITSPHRLESVQLVPQGRRPQHLSIKMLDEVTGLPECDVVGYRQRGTLPGVAYSALRMGIPQHKLPLSIDIVERSQMEQHAALSLGEVVRYASGVSTASSGEAGNVSETFTSRGFTMANSRNYFKDGIRYRKVSHTPLSTIERLEFLRGPASGLYGAVEPGGIVNIITRPALHHARRSLSLRTGSYGLYQGQLDLTGPLNTKRSVRYRLGGLYERSGSSRPHIAWQKWEVAPRLDLDLGAKTRLVLGVNYFADDRVVDPGVVHQKGVVLDGGRKLFLGEDWAKAKFNTLELNYTLRHQLSKAWRWVSAARYTQLGEDRLYFQMKAIKSDKMNRRLAHWDAKIQYYTFQNDFIGEYDFGDADYKLLVGAEYEHHHNRREVAGEDFKPIDLKNPAYSPRPTNIEQFKTSTDLRQRQNNFGLYVQNFLSLYDRLHIVLGVRADLSKSFDENYLKKTETKGRDFALTPRLALSYTPSEDSNLYGSYSASYVPTVGQTKEGKAFEPIRSYQWELGLKQHLLDKRLALSIALYHLRKTNVLTPDLDDPKYRVQVGEQVSKGLELGLHGKLYQGFSLDLNYALTLGKTTRSNDPKIPVGSLLASTPKHLISLWANYRIDQGLARGLSFGAGVLYSGERAGNASNTIRLGGYKTIDAYVAYSGSFYKLSLNGKNLGNEAYYTGAQGANLFAPAPERSLVLTGSIFF